MTTFRRAALLVTLACAVAGCAQTAPANVNTALAKEEDAVAPLKRQYKDVITGLEVKDRTLVVYVEPNAMYSMDEDAETAMKAQALSRWKKAWASAHPHEHGVVRVVVSDYFGREISRSSAQI
jgi:hypothetical protein